MKAVEIMSIPVIISTVSFKAEDSDIFRRILVFY